MRNGINTPYLVALKSNSVFLCSCFDIVLGILLNLIHWHILNHRMVVRGIMERRQKRFATNTYFQVVHHIPSCTNICQWRAGVLKCCSNNRYCSNTAFKRSLCIIQMCYCTLTSFPKNYPCEATTVVRLPQFA